MNRLTIILSALLLSMQLMADNYMQQAKSAAENEDYKSVIEYSTKQIAVNPNDVQAYLYRAAAYGAVEEYGKALSDADKAISLWNKKNTEYSLPDLYAFRATLYQQVGETTKAQADYDMAVKKASKNADAYFNRAEYYYDNEEYELAEADYRKALSLREDDSKIKLELSRCLIAQSKFDDAYPILNTLTKLEPRNVEARRLMAVIYLYKNEIRTFIDQYINYLSIADNGDLDLLSYGAMQEYAYAVKAITRVLNSADNKFYWLGVRARIHRENEQYEDALADLKRMEELSGDSPSPFVYYQMATCYHELYDYPMEIKYRTALIEWARANDYADADNYINRADAYLNNNEIAKALEDCDKAISLATEQLSVYYYSRGWINDMARDYEASFEDYDKAIRLDDGVFPSLYVMRGKNYLLHRNDSVRAKADFEKVLTIDTVASEGSARHYALAFLGRKEEAAAWITRVMEAAPDNVGVCYDAACLYSRIGDGDKAIDCLRQAFKLGYHNLNHMAQDDDLDAIRDREDYKEIIAKYKKDKVSNLFNQLTL